LTQPPVLLKNTIEVSLNVRLNMKTFERDLNKKASRKESAKIFSTKEISEMEIFLP
jgi:hypothetical protein